MEVSQQHGSPICAVGIWNSRAGRKISFGQPGSLPIACMEANEPHILCIIQTRRGSSRLPDKVLMPLQGKPLFIRQAERVKAAKLSGRVLIATTTAEEDDVIAGICRQE